MTIAGEVLSRVSKTLFDEAGARWTEAELLEYLTDAQREVVLLKPSAYTLNESVQLVQGSYQSLPANGVILVDVVANMGGDGATPGKSISQIDKEVLQACRPNWRTEAENSNTRHYMFDDRDPTKFEVYPAQPATPGYVRIVFGASPDAVTDVSDELTLSDIYDTSLYYLVLARCFSKTTGTQDFAKASSYQQLAVGLITGRKQTKQQFHPEQSPKRASR